MNRPLWPGRLLAVGTNDLDITSAITITGVSTNSTIVDGGGNDRVFDIQAGADVTLRLMTIRNGDATNGVEAALHGSIQPGRRAF